MFYARIVREAYNECVKLHPTASSELKHSLRSNERVPTFIDEVANEIEQVQKVFTARGQPLIEEPAIKGLVYDLTNMFILGIEKRAEAMHMSDAQKMLLKQQADYQRDLENMTGDFADILKEGVEVRTERDPSA